MRETRRHDFPSISGLSKILPVATVDIARELGEKDGNYAFDIEGETPIRFVVNNGKVMWSNRWEDLDALPFISSEHGGPATYGSTTFLFFPF